MRTDVMRLSIAISACFLVDAAGASEQAIDFPDGHRVSTQHVVIQANGHVSKHSHRGVESVYVVAGGGELHLSGQPSRDIRKGDIVLVPPGVEHSFDGGAEATRIVSTYVVERDRPAMDISSE